MGFEFDIEEFLMEKRGQESSSIFSSSFLVNYDYKEEIHINGIGKY